MCTIENESSLNSEDIIEALQTVFDPDIHYSIYDMGLIYKVTVKNEEIYVLMTLTSANCPEAENLPEEVKNTLKEKFSDYNISVEITYEPLWEVKNMTEEIQLRLGLL